MDKELSNAMYDMLKPKRYIEQTFIVQEGETLDEVEFIIQGKVFVSSKKDEKQGESKCLAKGNFYGEELVDWATLNPTLTIFPKSTKTIYALSEVEVFVLMASDLKTLVSNLWWRLSKNGPQNSKAIWKPLATATLQSAWRRYHQARDLKEERMND